MSGARRSASRRDVIAFGTAVGVSALMAAAESPAAADRTGESRESHLETRMFNFREDASHDECTAAIEALKESARAAGRGGFMIGRNLMPERFPTRFEWIYLIQLATEPSAAVAAGNRRFAHQRNRLASLCRNQVECQVAADLPAGFAAAPGARVRHTVLFDFKPDASVEARRRNVEAIRQMGRLPMVQHYFVRRTTAAARGPTQMEWQVIGDFASLEDYRAYSNAPVHLAIREDFTAHTSRVAFLDVDLQA